jgi:hypothetical protein
MRQASLRDLFTPVEDAQTSLGPTRRLTTWRVRESSILHALILLFKVDLKSYPIIAALIVIPRMT